MGLADPLGPTLNSSTAIPSVEQRRWEAAGSAELFRFERNYSAAFHIGMLISRVATVSAFLTVG